MQEKTYVVCNVEYTNAVASEQIYVTVQLHNSISEILGSNLDQYTGYPDDFLSLFRQIQG
jgi:hypothetical protein